jgi:hypothetical protein
MTPADLETYVRRRYNAVGDTFFPQSEIFNFFYDAQMQMAMECMCIKSTYTSSTVVDQRAYDWPDRAFAIRRIEVNGERILPNDFMSDDAQTGNNPDETITGDPEQYQVWGDSLYLRPVPDTAGQTIKIFSYDEPQDVNASTTIDVPRRYHFYLADYALFCMFGQDKNASMADRYERRWQNDKEMVKRFETEREIGDSFRVVKHEDELPGESGLLIG